MSSFLNQIKKGTKAKIIGFGETISPKIKRRLLELGFLCGTTVMLSQISFLNEVLLLELNGYTVSLRANIAKNILVDKN